MDEKHSEEVSFLRIVQHIKVDEAEEIVQDKLQDCYNLLRRVLVTMEIEGPSKSDLLRTLSSLRKELAEIDLYLMDAQNITVELIKLQDDIQDG